MELSTKALEFLRGDKRVRTLLALEMDKHMDTIERWVKNNDPMLTTASALQVIREHSGMQDEDLLTSAHA